MSISKSDPTPPKPHDPKPHPRELKSLKALAEEGKMKRYLCVCFEPRRRVIDGIIILPWAEFLDGLWNGEFDE